MTEGRGEHIFLEIKKAAIFLRLLRWWEKRGYCGIVAGIAVAQKFLIVLSNVFCASICFKISVTKVSGTSTVPADSAFFEGVQPLKAYILPW